MYSTMTRPATGKPERAPRPKKEDKGVHENVQVGKLPGKGGGDFINKRR